MDSLSGWLIDNKYELLSDESNNRMCKIRDMNNKSKKLLKVMIVSELDLKVVEEVVLTMKRMNNLNIEGLMKYKIIEMKGDSLYRVMREYKTHLDIINPVKYFEESGIFEILNKTIHSDLKPSNIFLNDENEVIINDYLNNLLYKGREGKKSNKNEDLCFVCIDELLGKELDISSDSWNFGLIFYYLKSGKYPFVGSNILETMKNIENVKYIPLECENGDKLNSFLRKILVKEKKDRLKLNEMMNELKKLNEAEVPVIPFEEEEIKINEELKRWINDEIDDRCKKKNRNRLDFRFLKMGSEGMKYLCSRLNTMNNVIYIDLKYNDLTSIGIKIFSKCLKYFPNLKGLYLGRGEMLMDNLHKCKELNSLGII